MNTHETEVLSPYAAANIVTEWLKATEFSSVRVVPQMMYQYVANERIPAHRDSEGRWQIRLEDLEEWYRKYINRKRELAAKAGPERKSA